MTPTKTECTSKSYSFGRLDRRQIIADFSGGQLTTDGGVILISKIDQQYRLSARLADCFSDGRDGAKVQHELKDLLAQRLYGLAQGYEDLNDHDLLRQDPMFGVAVGKLESEHARCAPLAGKSTLNRLEQAMHVKFNFAEARYVKLSLNPAAIANLLTTVSLEQEVGIPNQIILDMDVTNDELYGNQEQGFFNGYYKQVCYAPLLIFWGPRLLCSRLRPSNVDPAAGALEELQRLTGHIRQRWPQVRIIVRGDSAYSREDIMKWCEGQPQVEYVLAHATNKRLNGLTWGLEQRAKAAYLENRREIAETLKSQLGDDPNFERDLDDLVPPQIWHQSLFYCTEKSWTRERRLVCKLSYDAQGVHRHFVVTSFDAQQVATGKLHTDYYCPRGDMENRIKEHQLDLFSDRTSTHEFESNQLRVWFSSFAYVLIQALRHHCLADTELAQAQCGTIRLKILKVAAQIRLSSRRVLIALSSAWPGQDLFHQVYQPLQMLPMPAG